MNQQHPSRLATAGFIVVSALIGFILLLGVVAGIGTVAAGVGDDAHVEVDTVVPQSDLDSRLLGPGVEARGDLPVALRIEEPTSGQILLSLAHRLVPFTFVVAGLFLVWGLARSVRAGDPFGPGNVRRLRWLGALVLVGALALPLVSSGLQDALFATSNAAGESLEDGTVETGSLDFSTAPFVAGLCVLVLAEVFAHGVRLREDVEGTV